MPLTPLGNGYSLRAISFPPSILSARVMPEAFYSYMLAAGEQKSATTAPPSGNGSMSLRSTQPA